MWRNCYSSRISPKSQGLTKIFASTASPLHHPRFSHAGIHTKIPSSTPFVNGKLDLERYNPLVDPPVDGGRIPKEAYAMRVKHKYYPSGKFTSPSVPTPSQAAASSSVTTGNQASAVGDGCLQGLPNIKESCAASQAQPYTSQSQPNTSATAGSSKQPPSYATTWRPEFAAERWDAVIIGGGHNGLITAAMLAQKGSKVLVLERRHVLGGAAVSEELYPGFTYSRGSYLAGLMLADVEKEMRLKENGVEYLYRDPCSYTPTLPEGPHAGKDLLIYSDTKKTQSQIAQFDEHDANTWPQYEEWLAGAREIVVPALNRLPGGGDSLLHKIQWGKDVAKGALEHRHALPSYSSLLFGPAAPLLDSWFASPVLKATLATDAVIGSAVSVRAQGSAYVLLHHVMGQAGGREGAWAYVRGGMGSISQALAREAASRGVTMVTGVGVSKIRCGEGSSNSTREGWDPAVSPGKVEGVELDNGEFIACDTVVSNATPYHTIMELMASDVDTQALHCPPPTAMKVEAPVAKTNVSASLGMSAPKSTSTTDEPHRFLAPSFLRSVAASDRTCGAMKINMAVSKLPNFLSRRNEETCQMDPRGWFLPGPQHTGTVHFEENVEEFDVAHADYARGHPARKPIIEMTIPSSLDNTVAPPGQHVVQLFVQYVPYHLAEDAWSTISAPLHPTMHLQPRKSAAADKLAQITKNLPKTAASWSDPAFTEAYVTRILAILDLYLDDFSSTVLHIDALSPLELEKVFALQEGCIFHQAMSLSQIAFMRPVPGWAHHRLPVQGLYACGAGTHPGGGVMGAAGRNCAQVMLQDMKKD